MQPAEYPHWLEGGTPNTVGLAGLSAALDEIEQRGSAAILEHERTLAGQLIDQLAGDARFRVLGPRDRARCTGVVSFVTGGLAAQDLAAILDESFGIAVRAGLHCAPYLHQALDTFPDGAVRVSPGFLNTSKDITQLVDALREVLAAQTDRAG